MCGDFTRPGLPRKTTLTKEGSKVRTSQCGITAPGGHPNPAVPCLILRKLFNVSSSSSSWGGGSHTYSGAQAGRQGPPTRRAQALVEDDGFLKEPVGECPGLWRSAGLGPCLEWWVVVEPGPLLLSVAGSLVAGGLSWGQEGAYHSGEGGTDIRSREDCVWRGMWEAITQG